MAELNKVDIPIGITDKSKFDLSGDHQTTMSFMKMQPVFYRHNLEGERIDLSAIATVRPMPIQVPTYGRMRLNIRAFHVPFDLIFPQWKNFYHDTIGSDANASSLVSSSPYFLNSDVVNFFQNTIIVGQGPLIVQSPAANPDASNSDFFLDDNQTWYNFTRVGRERIKLFEALGYEINWNGKDNTPISALALLAYCRIYLDWYTNSQYMDDSRVLRLQQLLRYQDPITPLHIVGQDLGALTTLVAQVVYDNDSYYTNAWDNPVSPNNGQTSLFSLSDPTLKSTRSQTSASYTLQDFGVDMDSSGTPYASSNVYIGGQFSYGKVGVSASEYQHQVLKKLNNYVKSHQLAGARVIDRALANAGFVSQFDRLQRSVYLGGKSIDINIGDVMSTANTAPAGSTPNLGDYAGRSFGQGSQHWEVVCEDMGMIICVASIIPSGCLVQGMDRNNMHLSKMDFFQPRFDKLGVQAIQKREVYVSSDGSFGTSTDYDGVFGFTGRYGEYKRPKNWLSGDLRRKSVGQGFDSWTLFRLFDDAYFNSDPNNVVHSLDFSRGSDYANYNRIFNDTADDSDKFVCEFHFSVGTWSPAAPLFETYDFEEEAAKVTLTSNGTKMN